MSDNPLSKGKPPQGIPTEPLKEIPSEESVIKNPEETSISPVDSVTEPIQPKGNEETPPKIQSRDLLAKKILHDFDFSLLNQVPDADKGSVIAAMCTTLKIHQGPLPDPETLRLYNEIIPNGADRVMIMTEKQSNHRISIEEKVITGQLKESKLGQIFGLIIGLTAIICGTICILFGQPISGTIIGGIGLTSLVSAFIIGKAMQKRDLEKKQE